MSAVIDDSEDFYLMGYSFGGIMVQEIHKLKPAKKLSSWEVFVQIRKSRFSSKQAVKLMLLNIYR
jgi:alpha/beta superfamily hydrolase